MKKILATAMIILTVLCCFTACKKDEADDSNTTTGDIKVVDLSTTRPKEEPTTVKANKTMKITVPSSLIGGKADGNLQKYAETHGYDITEEKDGSITMKMDGGTYSLLLTSVGMDTIIALGDIVDSGDYPYVVRLGDYSEDFSYILMLVNNKKYDGSPSYEELAELIGLCGLYYQYFTIDKDNKCEVILADSKTGEVVYSKVYTE